MVRSAAVVAGLWPGFFLNLTVTPILAVILGLPFGSAKIGYLIAFCVVPLCFYFLLLRAVGSGRDARWVARWVSVGYMVGGVIPALLYVPALP